MGSIKASPKGSWGSLRALLSSIRDPVMGVQRTSLGFRAFCLGFEVSGMISFASLQSYPE